MLRRHALCMCVHLPIYSFFLLSPFLLFSSFLHGMHTLPFVLLYLLAAGSCLLTSVAWLHSSTAPSSLSSRPSSTPSLLNFFVHSFRGHPPTSCLLPRTPAVRTRIGKKKNDKMMSTCSCVVISHPSSAPPHTNQTLTPSFPPTPTLNAYLGRLLGVGQRLMHNHVHILRIPDVDLATVVRARHL